MAGDFITQEEAVQYILTAVSILQALNEQAANTEVKDITALNPQNYLKDRVLSFVFDKALVEELLSGEGVNALRIYYAAKPGGSQPGSPSLVMVPSYYNSEQREVSNLLISAAKGGGQYPAKASYPAVGIAGFDLASDTVSVNPDDDEPTAS
ncbi:hypothetical protein SAMN05444008_101402 [Cnuella takakiae]|uniref:Uncharacterized protein n=1 Tax=Cnuella takakiae TaxID=1302690 RepID=A0A1M4TG57_9BACT|nr:hypothetical protein [Cnuella takakiae]OLY90730.1 hypothetical protein BUE76_01565 [Cnuella takakiae]SHE43378.1 hypothetical protein SAMN05444008_101402 [Cnuella takakiae]